jgi:hypothetical protein
LALLIGKFGIVASINESFAAKKDPVARAGGQGLQLIHSTAQPKPFCFPIHVPLSNRLGKIMHQT